MRFIPDEQSRSRAEVMDTLEALRICKWMAELDTARARLIRANASLNRELTKVSPELAAYFQTFLDAGGVTHTDWCDFMYERFPPKSVPTRNGLRLITNNNNPHRITGRYQPTQCSNGPTEPAA
jgi:hypothetical protein